MISLPTLSISNQIVLLRFWGDWRDSNSRSLEPQSSVFTNYTTATILEKTHWASAALLRNGFSMTVSSWNQKWDLNSRPSVYEADALTDWAILVYEELKLQDAFIFCYHYTIRLFLTALGFEPRPFLYYIKIIWKNISCMHLMTEWRGFEPPDPVTRVNALAGRRNQPALPPLQIVPQDGIEPPTLGSSGQRSTSWATRA